MLAASVTAFSQTKTAVKDTVKQVEPAKQAIPFPITENNALPLMNLLTSYDQLLGNQAGLIITGNEIQLRRTAIAQFQQLVKEWAEKVQGASNPKAPQSPPITQK